MKIKINIWKPIAKEKTRGRDNYDHPPRKTQGSHKNKKVKKDFSAYEWFTCHKMGHISINYPMKEEQLKKRNKRFQAHATKDDDQEDEKRTKEDKIPVKNMF